MTSGEDARRRRAWTVVAVVAWAGFALTLSLSALGWYADSPPEPGVYGDTGGGAYGVLQRVTDTLSYFTIWSNVVVALAATVVARGASGATWHRVLLLDALLMIVVTAIVYQLLLAPSIDVQGWSIITDPTQHVVVPVLAVAAWVWVGPRGWVSGRLVPLALLVPVLWVAWMLLRGAVIGSYPYGFVAVGERGYPAVLATIAMILAFGLVVAAVLWAVDTALSRRTRTRA
ncbi:MAG: Pr6Pr family membrane protein [Actinomycetota bacterium]|nr:Pr6Pr family membrane protein [Actinomycetota bacterium]MEE3126297.1 Pr6Pr family membrane protein [Actinomycetota bacterium]